KYGISANTLQSWEKAKAGGLTSKGAKRILSALQQEGVNCSTEWLLYGIGHPAYFQTAQFQVTRQMGVELGARAGVGTQAGQADRVCDTRANYTISTVLKKEDKHHNITNVIQELRVFRALNPHAIDYIVQDDGMAPEYLPGDYVAGKKRMGEEIAQLAGKDCIVQTSANDYLLRRISKFVRPGVYNLTCTNLETSVAKYTQPAQELTTAAPVMWHRRVD